MHLASIRAFQHTMLAIVIQPSLPDSFFCAGRKEFLPAVSLNRLKQNSKLDGELATNACKTISEVLPALLLSIVLDVSKLPGCARLAYRRRILPAKMAKKVCWMADGPYVVLGCNFFATFAKQKPCSDCLEVDRKLRSVHSRGLSGNAVH